MYIYFYESWTFVHDLAFHLEGWLDFKRFLKYRHAFLEVISLWEIKNGDNYRKFQWKKKRHYGKSNKSTKILK